MCVVSKWGNVMRVIKVRVKDQESLDTLTERLGVEIETPFFMCGNEKTSLPRYCSLWVRNKKVTIKKESKVPKVSKNPYLDTYFEHMPPFENNATHAYSLIELHVIEEDLGFISKALDQNISKRTKSARFPKAPLPPFGNAWVSDNPLQHRYPIYVISKGRPRCISARALVKLGADFKIVVEKGEFAEYHKFWGDYVLIGDFDNFNKSSIPVRNWVHNHATSNWYWLMDDNIKEFRRIHKNNRFVCRDSTPFRAVEDFSAQFTNVGITGLNYAAFGKTNVHCPPYYVNTRVYSCSLMNKKACAQILEPNGDLWRGRYNEDTDLCLRLLKKGWCSILMHQFVAEKAATLTMKGGNTDSVYVDGDNRMAFARSLEKQHPDVVKVTHKFNRWHHHVDYTSFTQKLELRKDFPTYDYGLRLDPVGRFDWMYRENVPQHFKDEFGDHPKTQNESLDEISESL